MNKRVEGTRWEKAAADYLSARGVKIVDNNFRCRIGEIDLIGYEEHILVFIEVKYRRSDRYGSASEAVGYNKQQIIGRVSDYYRVVRHITDDIQIRYDVVAIQGNQINWIKNAFFRR